MKMLKEKIMWEIKLVKQWIKTMYECGHYLAFDKYLLSANYVKC